MYSDEPEREELAVYVVPRHGREILWLCHGKESRIIGRRKRLIARDLEGCNGGPELVKGDRIHHYRVTAIPRCEQQSIHTYLQERYPSY